MKKLSFVIPCYRSENTIELVVKEIIEVVQQRNGFGYEIILVNDCSPDQVWRRIQELVEKNQNIIGISLARNFGQHAALMAGYGVCTGDYVVSVDDDGQIPLESLFDLVDKLEEGYDVVFAYYQEEVKKKLIRRFGTWMSDKLSQSMLGAEKGSKGSSFYVARKFVIDEMVRYKNPYPYLGGLVLRTTRNTTSIPTKHRERIEGSSGYSFRKLFALWINGFTAFSVMPLRIAMLIGIICACAGFIAGIATIIRKMVYPEILMGYSSTMAVILFIGGVIMMILGMIGEYVGRIYICINCAPQYVVREMIGRQRNTDEKESSSSNIFA